MAASSSKSKKRNNNKRDKTRTNSNSNVTTGAQTQRNKCPGVRLIGGRIYDSQNGKSCHQCRQKTMDFVASCKKKTQKKQCSCHFCHRCLLNRYGEKAEELAELHNWMCPKCRGICNCSFCMKKRGQHPTGSLVRTAMAVGFTSVSEMLNLKHSNNVGSESTADVAASSKNQRASNKDSSNSLDKRCQEGNGSQRPSNSKVQVKTSKMEGVGVETRSSKLKKLRENNGNENASGDKKEADSVTQKSSPKRRQISKGTANSLERPSNSIVQAKHPEIEGIGIETRSVKLKRLSDNNRSVNVSVENNDAASITQNSNIKRCKILKRPSWGNENAFGDKKEADSITQKSSPKRCQISKGTADRLERPSNSIVQAKHSEIEGIGIETRSSKLKRLSDNNTSENVSGDKKDAASITQNDNIKRCKILKRRSRGNENASGDKKEADSHTEKCSPKSHQIFKGLANGFERLSNSMDQAKHSKLESVEIVTRSSRLKRLSGKNRSENVSGDKNTVACRTQRSKVNRCKILKQPSRGNKKIFPRDNSGQLIRTKSYMKIPEKDFQESINDHSETEMPNNVDIDDTVARHEPSIGSQSEKKNVVGVNSKSSKEEISLPRGIILSSVASIDIPAEDVGHAFQFLEFCEAFGQILNLGKGHSEQLLRELACGRSKRRVHSSPIAQFHIQLLSVIQKSSGKQYPYFQKIGEKSWVQVLVRYVSESHFALKELEVHCFELDDYDQLDISKKLKLLNFLCDEALGTIYFRSWIDEQNSKFAEREKKVKEKFLAEKKKKHKKLQDEITKACLMRTGAPLSISEHVDLVSKIKLEVAQTRAKTVEASEAKFEEKLRSEALRMEPLFLDGHGHKFWRLRCYSGEMNILLQDIEKEDLVAAKEKWYTYDIKQKAELEKYISSSGKIEK